MEIGSKVKKNRSLSRLSQSLVDKIFLLRLIYNRLSILSQYNSNESFQKSIVLMLVWGVLGFTYFSISIYLFNSLWYHIFFSFFSTIIFMFLCYEYYFDWLEKKIKTQLPRCCRKLAHYYSHYQGNIVLALKAVEEKGPNTTKLFMSKIRQALESVNIENEIKKLKSELPYSWLKMLCVLLMLGKSNGVNTSYSINSSEFDIEKNNSRDELEQSLRRITNIIYLINIEQGKNNAELFFIEIFMFISPYFFVIVTDIFNRQILTEMNAMDVYQGIQAQTLKALMFLVGNIATLFIHWLRKQQA